ncbi:hypothetical protein LAV73_22240 [Lysinibacillus xylanilyticus]|uniref:hypothetical protein n=1 Tax=Lysinibacillus xylanilyticus TaxID=582475 RepID=UPI002B254B77|nr:hypothetical protein [Lysinibacillus xylanilyticus]MEB2282650.1 hypothetical protein [Lysinibacillus xylanilyticus]
MRDIKREADPNNRRVVFLSNQRPKAKIADKASNIADKRARIADKHRTSLIEE